MIPQKIQALFDFIDYLDKNKREYIEKYIPLCDELNNLDYQREELNPNGNYMEKRQYDNIQAQINEKFSPIISNIHTPISTKLKELGIWTDDNTYTSIWNNNISAISDFKRDFKSEDVSSVMQYKQKYLSFRIETNTDFLCLPFVFHYLDEILKELFDFFKDTNENEFDSFETKTIKVNNIEEAVKGFMENKGKNVKFSIPTKTLYNNSNGKQMPSSYTNIKNELIMGDKIHIGDIPNNSGLISIGKENKSNISKGDKLAQKSFNWQKWGIIITVILAIIAIVITILVS